MADDTRQPDTASADPSPQPEVRAFKRPKPKHDFPQNPGWQDVGSAG